MAGVGKNMAAYTANSKKSFGISALIGAALVACVVGALVGYFLVPGGPASAGSLGGKTSLSESELDSTIASYSFNGQIVQISAREAIEKSSSLSSKLNEDGSYDLPSTEDVIGVVRSAIIEKEAENRGISLSDEDVAAYAKEELETDDFASIATNYGMDEEGVKKLLRQAAIMAELRKQIVTTEVGEAPEAPTAPEDGNEETKSKEYADYVIALAGDEWDAEKGAWKAEDGSYATALTDYEMSNEETSYGAAQAAYYVAYQDYNSKQSAATSEWTDFVNEVLCKSNFAICTLIS